MSVIAQGKMNKWGMVLFKDGWHMTHDCRKMKFRNLLHKPIWGDKFYKKYAKQLEHWKGEPKCIRCWEPLPPMLILMCQLGDKDSISACQDTTIYG